MEKYDQKNCSNRNSWGVILPQSVLKLLKVNPVLDELEFEIENNVLKIKKYPKEEK